MPESVPEYYSFDRVAGIYEATRYIPRPQLDLAARIIIEDAGLSEGDVFLDSGVGTGRFARSFAAQGLYVVGADISSEMLANAKRLSEQLHLVQSDLRRMPFRSGRFSAILAVHLLHLIVDWHKVVREIRRTLKSGSPFYVGHESGKHFRARQIYFELADETGASRPSLGASSLDAILEHLTDTGAQLDQVDRDRIGWNAEARPREVLQALRQSAFSQMWHLSPETNQSIVDRVEARLLDENCALDQIEATPAHLSIWRARWQS